MRKVNLLIVDDDTLLREGLKMLFEKEHFVNAVYEAADEDQFWHHILTSDIDIVLLDIRLKSTNGMKLLQLLKRDRHPSKVIAVTGLLGVELVVNLLRSGCNGIVYKLDGYFEIVKTISAVLEGESYFPMTIIKVIQSNARCWDEIPPVTLKDRELILMSAIARGLTTDEIARELQIPPATAETNRLRLMRKVGVPNTAALLAYAFRNGIL